LRGTISTNSRNAPRSQRQNECLLQPIKLFIADVRLPKTMQLEGCFTAYGEQSRNIGPQSCCGTAWRHKSSSRQNANDDDLLETTVSGQVGA